MNHTHLEFGRDVRDDQEETDFQRDNLSDRRRSLNRRRKSSKGVSMQGQGSLGGIRQRRNKRWSW